MKEVTCHAFITEIGKEKNIDITKEYQLLLPCSRIDLKRFVRGNAYKTKIVTKEGVYPYMLSETQRDTEKLQAGYKLTFIGHKTFDEIISEAKIKISSKKTKICEGGGWYSWGRKYFFNDIYCEF